MHWTHWVGRSAHGEKPFVDEAIAAVTWARLKRTFPDAGGGVLMPNHLHLIFAPADEAAERSNFQKMMGILGQVSRMSGSKWQPLPQPARIADTKHLLRTLRYLALNPCRDGLVDDPLKWRWSTYREVWGVSVDGWSGVLDAWNTGWNAGAKPGPRIRIHDYVTGDPDVAKSGRMPPSASALQRANFPVHSIVEIAQAALVACDRPAKDLATCARLRRYFIWLCRRVGMVDASIIGAICRMTDHAVRWHWRQNPPGPSQLEAGLRALGDPRFRHGVLVPFP